MEYAILLGSFNPNGDSVSSWMSIDVDEWSRVYYRPGDINGPGGEGAAGFDFYVLEVKAHGIDMKWDNDLTEVEVMFWGHALFDGVRHMYAGHEINDNFGYFHYPYFDRMKNCMNTIVKLEKKYCVSKYQE